MVLQLSRTREDTLKTQKELTTLERKVWAAVCAVHLYTCVCAQDPKHMMAKVRTKP